MLIVTSAISSLLFQAALSAVLAGSAAASSPAPSWAQSSPLTEDQAVALALKNNPRAQAALFDVKSASWGLRSASAFANPVIQFTPGITRHGSDVELLISQPLGLNGVRAARASIASAQLRRVEAQAALEVLNLAYETRLAFQEAVRTQDRLALSKELFATAEEVGRLAQRQVELGSRPEIERTQTVIEVRRARQAVALADAESQTALSKLRVHTGQAPESQIQLSAIEFDSKSLIKAQAVQLGLELRPEIALSRANRDLARQGVRLAKAEGVPDLAIQFRAENITREPRSSGFGLAFTIPLIDFGERRSRVSQMEAAAKSEEMRTIVIETKIRQEVEQAVALLAATIAVLQEFQDGLLREARQLYESTRTGFQLGQSTITSLLEAQRTYRSIQNEYIDALATHARAHAELERATGALSIDNVLLIPKEKHQ